MGSICDIEEPERGFSPWRMKEKLLPASKKAVTRENIRTQIRKPFARMPAFPELSDQDIRDIIEYLQVLWGS